MAEILHLDTLTKHELDTAEMLRSIAENDPEYAFVICWPKDGSDPTYHSNTGDTPVILMRINEFIHKYYNGDFE